MIRLSRLASFEATRIYAPPPPYTAAIDLFGTRHIVSTLVYFAERIQASTSASTDELRLKIEMPLELKEISSDNTYLLLISVEGRRLY